MLPADLAIQKQFLNLVKKKGYETGLDTEEDDLYNAYRTATGLDNFQTNALVSSTANQLVNEIDGNSKSFYDRNSTITDLDTGKSTKQLMVETPTGLIQRTVRPSGIMENDIPQPFGAPQSLSVDPYKTNTGVMQMADATTTPTEGKLGLNLMDYGTLKNNGYSDGQIEELQLNPKMDAQEVIRDIKGPIFAAANGGRVNYNQGSNWWDTLNDQGMNVYNSMKRGGHDDATIQSQLEMLGYYDPNSAQPDPTPDPTPDPNASQNQGRNDGPYAGQVVDQTDYGFNKKNYAPGEKLEINPAVFGMSFPDQPSAPKREGIINQAIDSFSSLPTRSLSSFASPTTGSNIVGPAEQGFMEQTLDIDPAGRTREDLRSKYDNYNRFFGRTSNYADAREKGKGAEMIGTAVGALSGIPFLGKGIDKLTDIFGPKGDKSLQGKYTVDNAGFGNTGARDEFGLATFNKKDGFLGLTGNTTRDYTNRMSERLGELDKFFGERIEGFDINNLTPDMLTNMKRINGFYTKQIQAYKDRLNVENLNRQQKDKEQAEEIAKQEQEAAFQAQLNETQKQQRMADLQRIERAYREDTGGGAGSYGPGGDSGQQSDGSYNDPFDPGGGE
jgi:hypothetical protein